MEATIEAEAMSPFFTQAFSSEAPFLFVYFLSLNKLN